MLHDASIVITGIAAMLILSDAAVRLSNRLMAHYGISGGLMGLTALSVGTSLFEIATHVVGSAKILKDPGSYGTLSAILIGSNLGSDIFQQNFVLPAIALVATVSVPRRRLFSSVGALVAATALLWLLCLDGRLSRADGALLVLLYGVYLVWLGSIEPRSGPAARRRRLERRPLMTLHVGLAAAFGLIALLAGPVLDAAARLVGALPISGSFFGVAALGVAAAMPELLTAIVAVRRDELDMASGILIGSNVTNPMLAAGLGSLVSTYGVPPVVTHFDLPMKLATGALIYGAFLYKERLGRAGAGALIVLYFAYLESRFAWFPAD